MSVMQEIAGNNFFKYKGLRVELNVSDAF